MKNRSHPMKTFLKINLRDLIFIGAVLLILWLLPACNNTRKIPKPEPWVEITSDDPNVLIYPSEPIRIIQIRDSLDRIILTRKQASYDSLLYIIEGQQAVIDSQRSLIFTLKEQLQPARGAR